MPGKNREKNSRGAPRASKPVPGEAAAFHTRILRMSLSLEDNRSYWENHRPGLDRKTAPTVAFEERWFGAKSMARVRLILINFRYRYDAWPMALGVLRQWRPADPVIRQNICHWHLQLADPLYRKFTGEYLVERRKSPAPRVDRDVVSRWLMQGFGDQWAASTANRIARNLISSAAEAGLCSAGPGPRDVIFPRVDRTSLAYLLYLLRHVPFKGRPLTNPYLASAGIDEGQPDRLPGNPPGLAIKRVGGPLRIAWKYDDLKSWAAAELSPPMED
ncbi:MAG: hypothetical protein GY859_26770 [Desulfobacterales bacterium]|nr:hypothetical protein [Desulfobacterales bacterium]